MNELPNLPEPGIEIDMRGMGQLLLYTEEQMKEYASTCINALIKNGRRPCQTCISLARTVMMDQTGAA